MVHCLSSGFGFTINYHAESHGQCQVVCLDRDQMKKTRHGNTGMTKLESKAHPVKGTMFAPAAWPDSVFW